MKKIKIIYCMFFMLFASCKIVETSSVPASFTLNIVSKQEIWVFLLNETGEFQRVMPDKDHLYRINISSMRGGYSTFLFVKYNEHNPEQYKVVRFIRGKAYASEMSITELRALPEMNGIKQLIIHP